MRCEARESAEHAVCRSFRLGATGLPRSGVVPGPHVPAPSALRPGRERNFHTWRVARRRPPFGREYSWGVATWKLNTDLASTSAVCSPTFGVERAYRGGLTVDRPANAGSVRAHGERHRRTRSREVVADVPSSQSDLAGGGSGCARTARTGVRSLRRARAARPSRSVAAWPVATGSGGGNTRRANADGRGQTTCVVTRTGGHQCLHYSRTALCPWNGGAESR